MNILYTRNVMYKYIKNQKPKENTKHNTDLYFITKIRTLHFPTRVKLVCNIFYTEHMGDNCIYLYYILDCIYGKYIPRIK